MLGFKLFISHAKIWKEMLKILKKKIEFKTEK
jgi:hypothetical protein